MQTEESESRRSKTQSCASRERAQKASRGHAPRLAVEAVEALVKRVSKRIVSFIKLGVPDPCHRQVAAAAAYTLGPTTDNRADSTHAYTSTYDCIRFSAPRET